MGTRYTVVGAGGIGGTVGAHLAHCGETVTFVDADRDHVAAIRERGLTLEKPQGSFTERVPALLPTEVDSPLHIVLLAVRSVDTEVAVQSLLPHLGPDSYVVSLQNGLNEPAIARLVGDGRTVGAFVNFSAEYIEPGLVRYWGTGPFCIGELDGRRSERVTELATVLERCWGPATITDNVFGYLWAKEAYINMLTPIRLVEADQAEACEYRPRLLVELASEVIELALIEGIRLESFNSFEPHLYFPRESRDAARLDTSFRKMVDYMRMRQKPRPGSYRRVPDVGQPEAPTAIARRLEQAAKRGLEMPLTRAAVAEVERAGSTKPGWSAVDRLDAVAARLYD